ncbi:MAG: prepilin peptidase [Burkholderiales bacterium]|nr:prepilin peptidase [Phycisphaerae bacterium]
MPYPFLAYLPLILLLAVGVVIDWRERRIPNWLNLLTMLLGFVLSCVGVIPISPLYSFLGVLAGLVLVIPRVLLGATGAGDLKQHMAVGAWAGPLGILIIMLAATVAGGVMAIAQAIHTGKFASLLRNSAILAINLAHVRELGVDHIQQSGKRFRSIDRPLPYAVPMMVAVLGWWIVVIPHR